MQGPRLHPDMAAAPSPHPGPLPKGEGETPSAFRQGLRAGLLKVGAAWLPLPEGEGRGERKGVSRNQCSDW